MKMRMKTHLKLFKNNLNKIDQIIMYRIKYRFIQNVQKSVIIGVHIVENQLE